MADETSATADDKLRDLAITEWKELGAVIGRYDGYDISIRGWLLVLIGVLLSARYGRDPRLAGGAFFLIALFGLIALMITEGTSRVIKRHAIRRSREIEFYLNPKSMDGWDDPSQRFDRSTFSAPMLNASLTSRYDWGSDLWTEFRKRPFWIFYAAVALVIVVGAVA